MKQCVFYICIAVLCLANYRCGDFLEVYSQDLVYASSCEDLDEVLIGNGYMASGGSARFVQLFVMDDDVDLLVADNPTSSDAGHPSGFYYYTWQRDPLVSAGSGGEHNRPEDQKDDELAALYEHIAYANTIINYVDEFPDDPIEDRMRIKGEAEFLRAAYYLVMSNLYGHAYDPANGGSDWSVPLKTYEYVVKDHFSRASVAEVYDQIVADLEDACVNLKGVRQPHKYRADELSARVLLSRVLLYREDYERVIEECDAALELNSQLADLNTWDVTKGTEAAADRDYLLWETNPEIVFSMGGQFSANQPPFPDLLLQTANTDYCQYVPSSELLGLFRTEDANVQDLRYESYFAEHYQFPGKYCMAKAPSYGYIDGSWLTIDPTVFDNFVLRTAELYLNKAEAQAMTGDVAGAAATLQPFLATRYATGKLPQVGALGEKEMVDFIRTERRKEFCFEGHRWPDLKRYAVNSKYPEERTIRHNVYESVDVATLANYGGYYDLGTYGEDDGWILGFPQSEIIFNDGELENPERPDRFNGDPAFREETTESTDAE